MDYQDNRPIIEPDGDEGPWEREPELAESIFETFVKNTFRPLLSTISSTNPGTVLARALHDYVSLASTPTTLTSL
jgi:hypothetical protein